MIRRMAPARSAKIGPESGFTLVELMVAITIGAMIATLLAASLRMTIRFHDTSARQATERGDVMDRLRLQRFLGSALAAIPGTGVTEELTLHSGGDGQRLTVWISPGAFDIPGEPTDPCRLELSTCKTPGLLLTLTPVDPAQNRPIPVETDAAQTASPKPLPLLNQRMFPEMQRCVIDVLSTDGEWRNEWPDGDRNGQPCAVRIRFEDTGSRNFRGDTAGGSPGSYAAARHRLRPGHPEIIIRLLSGNSCGKPESIIGTAKLPPGPGSGRFSDTLGEPAA